MPIKDVGVNAENISIILGVNQREVVILAALLALAALYKFGNAIFASPSAFDESAEEC